MPQFIYATSLFLNSLTAVLLKMFGGIPVYDLILMRSFFSFLFLTPFILYTKEYTKIKKTNIKLNVLSSLLIVFAILCYHTGNRYVPINSSAVINSLMPITIVIFSAIYMREKISKELYIAVLFCTATVFIVAKPKAGALNFGYILLFGDIIGYSVAMLIKKKIMNSQSVLLTVYINLVIFIPITFYLSGYNYQFLFDIKMVKIGLIISCIYVVEFFLLHLAYSKYDAGKLQPVRFFRIVYAVALSYLILHEQPRQEQIIGACLIVIANIIMLKIESNRKTKIITEDNTVG